MGWPLFGLSGDLLLLGTKVGLAVAFYSLWRAARGKRYTFPTMFAAMSCYFWAAALYRAAVFIFDLQLLDQYWLFILRFFFGCVGCAVLVIFLKLKADRLIFLKSVRDVEEEREVNRVR